MRFPITAQLAEGGSSCSALSNGIILLPTVVVPGVQILNSDGGDHTFKTLEQTLTALSVTSVVGQAYQLRNNPQLGLGSCASNGVRNLSDALYTQLPHE
jgi:hypothetical protein